MYTSNTPSTDGNTVVSRKRELQLVNDMLEKYNYNKPFPPPNTVTTAYEIVEGSDDVDIKTTDIYKSLKGSIHLLRFNAAYLPPKGKSCCGYCCTTFTMVFLSFITFITLYAFVRNICFGDTQPTTLVDWANILSQQMFFAVTIIAAWFFVYMGRTG
jgi:hypothetical protein